MMITGKNAIRAFQDNLVKMYYEAEYNVIFPNGTKVPITQVQERMTADPSLRPLKMMGDKGVPSRPLLVVEMTIPEPDGSQGAYFRQAFYLSTGSGSSRPNTWLPCDGLVYGGQVDPMNAVSYMRAHGGYYGIESLPKPPLPDKTYDVYDQIWISKEEFASTEPSEFYLEPTLERLGPLSHMIASYYLGGGTWERPGAASEFAHRALGSMVIREIMRSPFLEPLLHQIREPRPVIPLFMEFLHSPDIPITPVAEINAYVERNRATSYMNAFIRMGEDVDFSNIPGLYITAMQGEKRFRLVLHAVMANLRKVLADIAVDIRWGRLPPTKAAVEGFIARRSREIGRIGYRWNLLEHIDRIRFHLRPDREVTGGRRRKTRRFKMPRKYSRKYCKKTPCKRMGFTQRASCRPYKNCF